MNRYEMKPGVYVDAKEAEDGKWVKFVDVEGIEKIGFGRVHCALCCELSGCNCEENWKLDREWDWSKSKEYDHELICPAHGYKKL